MNLDWIKNNKRLTTIIAAGAVANIALLIYVFTGFQDQGTLKQEVNQLASDITSKNKQVPDSSQLLAMSNQIRLLKNHRQELKGNINFAFPSFDKKEDPDSRQVQIQDKISLARTYVQNQFQAAERSVPSESLGFPETPKAANFDRQMRRIELVKHLFDLLLKNDVQSISGISARTDKEGSSESSIKAIQGLEFLTTPLQLAFQSTLNTLVKILYQLQQPDAYLQLLSMEVSSIEQDPSATSGDPVLEVRLTVVPISLKKSGKTTSDDQNQAGTAGVEGTGDGTSGEERQEEEEPEVPF